MPREIFSRSDNPILQRRFAKIKLAINVRHQQIPGLHHLMGNQCTQRLGAGQGSDAELPAVDKQSGQKDHGQINRRGESEWGWVFGR